MHLPEKQSSEWYKICEKEKHFDTPMIGTIVLERIQKIFPDYAKGDLPSEIQINRESLSMLCKNQKNVVTKFRSDFADVIEQLLKS